MHPRGAAAVSLIHRPTPHDCLRGLASNRAQPEAQKYRCSQQIIDVAENFNKHTDHQVACSNYILRPLYPMTTAPSLASRFDLIFDTDYKRCWLGGPLPPVVCACIGRRSKALWAKRHKRNVPRPSNNDHS